MYDLFRVDYMQKKNKDVTIVIIVIIVTTYINFYAYRVPKVW